MDANPEGKKDRQRTRSRSRSPLPAIKDMQRESATILAAIDRATMHFKLCPNRVWSVAAALPGKEKNLPRIVPPPGGAHDTPREHHEDHSECTFDFCEYSQRDFTSVPQRHEPPCSEGSCTLLTEMFPREVLIEAALAGTSTAWSLGGREMVSDSEPRSHMAISHVWSDGSGCGAWAEGHVNECLYNFFRDIAEQQGCKGIWWDAICIPREKAARSRAIAKIQTNYQNARITLVHDCFLRNWEWSGPEAAAFAIVMSPWFSRGWTALELAKSHTVKVIFKDPGPSGGTLVKDLDKDILEPIREMNAPAAKAIVNLRTQGITKIDDLLTVLGPRHTSWPRDFAIISGLLIDVDISGASQQGIYQKIITKIGTISHDHLFHGSATMSKDGFTWCPTSLLDMPVGQIDATLSVKPDGGVVGPWKALNLKSVKNDNYIWAETHPVMRSKLQYALADKRKHVLLVEPQAEANRAVMVRVMQRPAGAPYVPCKFVASVYFQTSPWGELKELDRMCMTLDFKIGGNEPTEDIVGEAWGLMWSWGEEMSTPGITESDRLTGSGRREEPPFVLMSVAANGDKEAVAQLLERRVRIDAREPYPEQRTALHRAAWWGHIEIVELLVAAGADKTLKDEKGLAPLHLAIDQNHLEIFKLLLADVDEGFKTEKGDNVLQYAARRGSPSAVEVLLATEGLSNLDVNAENRDGKTALHLAGQGGSAEVVEQLLRAGARPEALWRERTPLHCAIEANNEDAAKALIREAPYIEIEDYLGETALQMAVQKGYVSLVESLLLAKADPENGGRRDQRPIQLAVDSKNLGALKLLLECEEVDIYEKHEYRRPIITQIIESKDAAMIELLGKVRGVKTFTSRGDSYKGSPAYLRDAVANGDKVLVKGILNAYMANPTGVDIASKYPRHPGDPGGETLLQIAVTHGHTAIARLFLETGKFDADNGMALGSSRGWGDNSYLPKAVEKGDDSMAELLIEYGADVGLSNYGGRTALGYAIERKNLPLFKYMFEKRGKALFDQKDRRGNTALSLAAEGAVENIVRFILGEGGPEVVGSKNDEGQTPLSVAAKKQHWDIFNILLLEGKADINSRDKSKRTPLIEAALSKDEDGVKRILGVTGVELDAEDADGNTILLLAAANGWESVVAQLLSSGRVDANSKDSSGRTPLSAAAASGHTAVVKLLMDSGVVDVEAPNQHGTTPLAAAAERGEAAVVKSLLDSGKVDADSKDQYGRTPLSVAALRGEEDVVEQLLKSGKVDAESRDSFGCTPLCLAAMWGQVKVIKLLLTVEGVDVNSRNDMGRTPLLEAICGERETASRLLLSTEGVDISARDSKGRTALHIAAAHGFTKLVKLVLETDGGANLVNAKNQRGDTPLSKAAKKGHSWVVELLLDTGIANLESKNNFGRTALWLAKDHRRPMVAGLLKRAGARE